MSLVLRIPRRLESPNKSRGAHWRVRHRITLVWAGEVAVATLNQGGADVRPLFADGFRHAVDTRMRVTVERHVPSGRNFIRDDDNLRFSVKPLLDALKRQGYIKNDSRKWLDHPTPTQHVSEDGKDYTIITIEPAT